MPDAPLAYQAYDADDNHGVASRYAALDFSLLEET